MKHNYSNYTYKYLSDSEIQFTGPDGDGVESGVIVKGRKRTRQIQTGTETVVVGQEPVLDENGLPTYEQVPAIDQGGNPITDDNGQPIMERGAPIMRDVTEEQPVFETQEYELWKELLATGLPIAPIPQSIIDERKAAEEAAARQQAKLNAFAFKDVQCSALENDQNGWGSITQLLDLAEKAGQPFTPINFRNQNGNTIPIDTREEWDLFVLTGAQARAQFF